MKVGAILKLLESQAWRVVRTRGSHRQLRHEWRPGTVTIAGKPSLELTRGTLKSIMRQAGLTDPRRER